MRLWSSVLSMTVLFSSATYLQAQFLAGASAVDVTPVLCSSIVPADYSNQFDVDNNCFRWVHLGGFSPYVPFRQDARIAEGIHDRIWARTIALADAEGDTLVIVAVDLPGLGRKHTARVRRQISREYDIPIEHIVLHSTHTHSAPDASGYWSTLLPGHNDRYTTQLRQLIYSSIRNALSQLRPAVLTTVTTTHVSCQDSGTGRLKFASDCRLPDLNYEIDDGAANYDHFILQRDLRDPIVRNTQILAAELADSETGDTIATLVNWHNHPDTLGSANRHISSDYPHYLREYMEQSRGGVSLFIAGTIGNQISALRGTLVPLWNVDRQPVFSQAPDGTKIPVLVSEGWDKIRSIGYEIGHAASSALEIAIPVATPDIEVLTTSFETRVDNFIHLLGTWSVWYYDVEPEDQLSYHWPSCWGLLGCVKAEVSLLKIGDLSMLTAPGEIDPAYALGRPKITADYGSSWGKWHFPSMNGVEHRMPGKHHGFIGSAQDYLSYLVPQSDNTGWWNFDHPNHYEEWVTIGKNFGDDVARAWDELLLRNNRRRARTSR